MTTVARPPGTLRIGVFLLFVAAATLVGYLATNCGREGEVLRSSLVNTTAFDGRYRLVAEESFPRYRDELAALEKKDAERKERGEPEDPKLQSRIALLQSGLDGYVVRWSDLTIERGVIRAGTGPVQEFSLKRATIDGGRLVGVALWHEDVQDPGDCVDEPLRLELRGTRLEFVLGDEGTGFDQPAVYERSAEQP